LRDAIEAGIAAAECSSDFPAGAAKRLRRVGLTATVVARGTYTAYFDHGASTKCPVGQAFLDWREVAGDWNLGFTREFDRATFRAVGSWLGVNVLHIADDNTTEGET
jgi:hypothetical protein